MSTAPTFLNSGSDCTWLRETHLKPGNFTGFTTLPTFKSFVLIGNEDCPTEIVLYSTKNPTRRTNIIRATLCEGGKYAFPVENYGCCYACHQKYNTPTPGYDGLCCKCVPWIKELNELKDYANGGPL